MKSISKLIIVFTLWLSLNAQAQDQFALSQYYQVYPILNPALTGVDDFLDLKIGYRKKWAGFDNSPSTSFVSAFSAIGDKTSYNQAPIRTSNPNQLEFIESQKSTIAFHGVGGYVVKQEQGAFNQVNIGLNYAYHIPINTKIRVSLGTTLGFSNLRIDPEKISVWDMVNDPVYQAYANGDANYTSFFMSLGGAVYGKKSFGAFSYQPVFNVFISGEGDELPFDHKFVIMAGTKFTLGPNFELIPSVLAEVHTLNKSRYVGNLLLNIKSIVKTGVGYSSANDLSISAIFNIKNDYGLGYSFETSVGKESAIGNGTHEIILSFSIFNHLNAPSRLW